MSTNGNATAILPLTGTDLDLEKQIINQAHGATVTSIYNNFKDSYAHASDEKEREAIKERFTRSIQNARKIRNVALSILPKLT